MGFDMPCALERLKALMFGHFVDVKGEGSKKCADHNEVPNEFLFPSASLIQAGVRTSARTSLGWETL